MSRIKELLDELSELTMSKIKLSEQIPEFDELEYAANVLKIITSSLVELGVNENLKNKIEMRFIELETCDWEGKLDGYIKKVRPEGILSYNESIIKNDDKEIKLIDVQTHFGSFSINMKLDEFEKLLVE